MELPEEKLVAQLGCACREVGFFQVKNHRIPPAMMKRVIEDAARFFQLPQASKDELSAKLHNGARGYFGKGDENLGGVGSKEDSRDAVLQPAAGLGKHGMRVDNKEGFDMGSSHLGPSSTESAIFGHRTPFPAESLLPGYELQMNEYHTAMIGLGRRLLGLMALSLGLAGDYFDDKFSRPVSTLRTLHYYPKTNYQKGEVGAGAHTDYGGLTILLQGTGGLQVLSSARGEWVHVPPTAGLFTVNIGDMMMRWTNDRYSSTVHRVINLSNRDRFSVPFFFNPNLETEVVCLPTCEGDKEPKEPVVARDVLEDFYTRAGFL